jgi:hypothetical protein
MPRHSPFADDCLALAWGAWSELGVSGWTTTHKAWAVDPEPLILFTAWLADRDARLRDEATDWCIRYERKVSKVRLKNLGRSLPPEVRDAFGVFSATVSAHIAAAWPDAGGGEPRDYRPTGRSALPSLDRPSLAWLRLRALFGLGAKTEILRLFLTEPHVKMSANTLAQAAGYAKRNVAEECETLHQAGVLHIRQVGNRFMYSLARGPALAQFVGGLPEVTPNWTAVFNVARALAELDEAKEHTSSRTLPVKARRVLRQIEDDLTDVDAKPVSDAVTGPDLWNAVEDLGAHTLSRWAKGQWTSR